MNTRTIIAHRHAKALAMFEAGDSYTDIGRKLGYHRTTILNAVRRARQARDAGATLPPVHRAMTEPTPPKPNYQPWRGNQQRAEMAREYRAMGYSWPEVARLAGYRSHSGAMGAACR